MKTEQKKSKLVLVASPIGNIKDISLRALEVLGSADVIAAEDTRHSAKLLKHYNIKKELVRLDAHTIEKRAAKVLEKNAFVAYLSDAGTPGISDPGAELVRLAIERGIEVEVLPGPTAFVPALVLSGLDTSSFSFFGFLARKGRAREIGLEQIADNPITSIIYESPKRVIKTLTELADYCGLNRQISVSREISKLYETTYRGSIDKVLDKLREKEPRGEFVIVIQSKTKEKPDYKSILKDLKAIGLAGRDLRQALENKGIARNLAYKLSLSDKEVP